MKLSTLQFSILLALIRYRFLVCSQLHAMGLGSLSALRRSLRILATIEQPSKLVHRLTFAPSARFGKVEHMYSITPYGMIFLQEHLPGFISTRSLKPVCDVFHLDYRHRRETISFRIRLEQALRQQSRFEILSYANYFEKAMDVFEEPEKAVRSAAATEVQLSSRSRIIPDSVIGIGNSKDRGLYVLEVELSEKKSRILQKVRTHLKLLADGALSVQYGQEGRDYRVLFVLQHEQVLQRVLHDLEKDQSFAPFCQHVLFATIAETEHDVLQCWHKVDAPNDRFHGITGQKRTNKTNS
jgi:hypothetical protein